LTVIWLHDRLKLIQQYFLPSDKKQGYRSLIIDFDTPTYNLRAVVQETGLKADTLRAWERRYGLPVPERSDGGHRLYSRRDIEILKWLASRVAEGLTISRAVELWRNLEAAGEDPIADLLPTTLGQPQPIVDAGSTLDEIREAWISACLRFDEQAADAVISQAFAIFPIETVTHQILRGAMSEIGEKWFSNEISVQQEHFISQLTLKRLDALIIAAPRPTRSERIILTCPPGEDHTISLVMLTLGLKRMGFQVYYFGADTPIDQLGEATSSIKPNLVISSSQQLSTTPGLLSLATKLFEEEIPFAFGGGIFNMVADLQEKIPGHFLGETLDGVYGQIEKIVSVAPLIEFRRNLSNPHIALSEGLLNHQSDIIRLVSKNLEAEHIPQEVVTEYFTHLFTSVLSALRIGDPNLVIYDLGWLGNLLENRAVNTSTAEKILNQWIVLHEGGNRRRDRYDRQGFIYKPCR
jgi:DNA-binding transcriptional MerR regulator